MYDVTVSVWNTFHSIPLIAGLHRAGLRVRSLSTGRRKPAPVAHRTAWAAGLALQSAAIFPRWATPLHDFSLDAYERFAARHALDTRCFWGWSNHHLSAFRRAREQHIPIIVECGSTHTLWQRRVVEEELVARGQKPARWFSEERVRRTIEEYEVADRIAVPSSVVAESFIEMGIPESKLVRNPFGVDVEFWSAGPERERPDEHVFVFAFVAQLMLRKGIYYLLDAWKKHFAVDRRVALWLIGPHCWDAESLLRDLPSNVRLLGTKSHAELRALYRDVDAFVLPSLEEGMARSVLEAMAAGVAPIVTRETGVTDVLVHGEDGWVVSARSGEALAAAMSDAVAHRAEARRRGRSAQARVRPYGWTAYGDRAAAELKRFLRI